MGPNAARLQVPPVGPDAAGGLDQAHEPHRSRPLSTHGNTLRLRQTEKTTHRGSTPTDIAEASAMFYGSLDEKGNDQVRLLIQGLGKFQVRIPAPQQHHRTILLFIFFFLILL
jgi:hypothetical protein